MYIMNRYLLVHNMKKCTLPHNLYISLHAKKGLDRICRCFSRHKIKSGMAWHGMVSWAKLTSTTNISPAGTMSIRT